MKQFLKKVLIIIFFSQCIMMRSSRLEYTKKIEDSTIEHAKNLFKLKKEIDDSTIKYVGNLFRLKKKKKK